MGDETEADWAAYKAALGVGQQEPNRPVAEVVWLKGCRICNSKGFTNYATFNTKEPNKIVYRSIVCGCVANFNCPQCGHKHGRPFFAASGEVLECCWVCGWRRHEKETESEGHSSRKLGRTDGLSPETGKG